MHRLRRQASDEQGFILVIAMLVLFVVGILSLVVFQSGITANGQSKNETARRIALEDANAGLQAAVARLSAQPFLTGQTYAVAAGDCFNTADAGAVPVTGADAGYCTGFAQSESLGALGSYEYDISQGLTSGGSPGCTGYWLNQGSAFASVTQRCITATGTYGGVTQRVQERVAAENWAFPVNGILSLGIMEFDTSGAQYLNLTGGRYESNGIMTIGRGTQTKLDDLKEATLETYASFSWGTGEKCEVSEKCTATKVGTRFAATTGPTAATYNAVWSANNNKALTEGAWAASKAYVSGPEGFEFNAMNVGKPSGVKLATQPTAVTMPEGTYIFCKMTMNNSAIQTAGKVTIYIDSNASGDGKCGKAEVPKTEPNTCKIYAKPGSITIGKSDFYNPSGIAGDLQIYVYGNGPEPAACEIPKGGPGSGINIENEGNPKTEAKSEAPILTTAAELYAPSAFLTTTGEGIWWSGGLVVGSMESNDNDIWGFTGTPPTQAFYPTAWTTCPPKPSSSADFGSGCY